MREINEREKFIRQAKLSEIEWCFPTTENKIIYAYVGPWRCCTCGFESRNAGKMFDHVCSEHQFEQLELFPEVTT
jgi:hypothetical protein